MELENPIKQRLLAILNLPRLVHDVGIKIKVKKIKAVRMNNMNTDNIMLQSQAVVYVDNFCYLGSNMTTNGSIKRERHSDEFN